MSEVFEGESYDPNMQTSLGNSLKSLFGKLGLIGKGAAWGGVSAVPGLLPAGLVASRLMKQHQRRAGKRSKRKEYAKERQEAREARS